MATQVQFRRGTAVQHTSFTGAAGEVTVNTTNKSVHVHDGTTASGFELARADLSNTSGLTLSGVTSVTDLNVARNLYVSGVSTFVGNVTFQGGTINLGDSNTDNVVFTADVNSNIIPNTDNAYDFGNVSQRWRNANFAGVVTSTSFVGALTGNVTGNIVGNVTGNITGDINSSGVSTFSTINVGSAVVVSTSTTTTTTSATSVASISASTYRSAVFQVQAVQGTTYNMTTINVIHDGTETYMTEYGTINQPVGIATFATDISAGSLRLLSYPSSISSTTFRVITTATQI